MKTGRTVLGHLVSFYFHLRFSNSELYFLNHKTKHNSSHAAAHRYLGQHLVCQCRHMYIFIQIYIYIYVYFTCVLYIFFDCFDRNYFHSGWHKQFSRNNCTNKCREKIKSYSNLCSDELNLDPHICRNFILYDTEICNCHVSKCSDISEWQDCLISINQI